MLLDLKPLFAGKEASLPVDFSVDLSDLDFSGIKLLKTPVKIVGNVISHAGIVEADFTCRVEVTAPCDRCFKETVKSYNFKLNRTLVTNLENEDTDDMTVVPDMKLDLNEFCYDDILLSLPTKFLCSDNCKGLCPTCGQDLNKAKCSCEEKEIDPRLAALAELLKD